MLRKVEQPIPEELRSLLIPEEAAKVIFGSSMYEMAPMGLEDFEDVKMLWGSVMDMLSQNENVTTDAIMTAVVQSGIFQKVIAKIYGFTEEDLNKITLAQMLYAAEVFIRINFFCLPPSSLQGIARIIAYFVRIFSALDSDNDNLPQNILTKESPTS